MLRLLTRRFPLSSLQAQDAVEELEEELRTRVLQISLVENERDQLMIQMEILLHMVCPDRGPLDAGLFCVVRYEE